MTTSEFKYSIEQSVIGNTAQKVLINYNQYGPIYRIDDIAILIEAGNLAQLQQATRITLKGPSADTLNIPVDNSSNPVRVVNRQIVTGGLISYYVYSVLTENQRVVVESPTEGPYSTDVIIEPGVNATISVLEDYSVLQANVDKNRESAYIVTSDRSYSTSDLNTNPVNLYSIVNNLASPAQIQDSNYTDTGWTNARYEGSKLNTLTNQNTDPFLQGTFFEAAIFGKDVADSYITELQPSELTYQQLFYSGKLSTLQYTLENINAEVRTSYSNGSTVITLKSDTSSPLPYPLIPPLNVGELFRAEYIDGPNATQISPEIFQMTTPVGTSAVFPYTFYTITSTGTALGMQVKRGYNLTPIDSSVGYESRVFRIVPTIVYNITGNSTRKLTEGKLRVKGATDVVYIDNSGLVVSGSTSYYI